MFRFNTLVCVLLVGFGVGLGQVPTARAQTPELLKIIPADAAAILIVNDLAQTSARIEALAEKLPSPLPSPLMALKAHAGITEGLAENGSFAAVALLDPSQDGTPPTVREVTLIPVSDYAAVVRQLQPRDPDAAVTEITIGGHPMWVGRKGNFAVMVRNENRELLDKVLSAESNIADTVAPLADWIAGNQATLVLTPSGTTTLLDAAHQGLEQVKQMQIPGQDPATFQAGIGMYQKAVEMLQSQVTQIGVALAANPETGVEVQSQLLLKPDSTLARSRTTLPRLAKPATAGLPAVEYVIAGEGVIPAGLVEDMVNVSLDMMKALPRQEGAPELTDEKLRTVIEASMGAMKDVTAMSMVLGVGSAGAGMYDQTTLIVRTKDAKAYIDSYEAAMKRMQEVLGGIKLPYMGSYETERTQIAGEPVLRITVDMSEMIANQPAGGPDLKQLYEKLIGPGGKMAVFVAAANPQTVVIAYSSEENLQRALTAARSGQLELAADAQLARTAELLPDSAQWVGYLSLSGLSKFVARMVGAVAGPAAPPIPLLSESPPVGLAAELRPDRLVTHMQVPLETMQATTAFIARLRGMALPPQVPPPQAPQPIERNP